MEALTPRHGPQWDRYVTQHPEATLFHTPAWSEAVQSTFDHKPIYLAAWHDERIVGILPLSLVLSRAAGRMLVSVPYGVGGGILADSLGCAALLFDHARQLARELGCGVIDLRGERGVVPDLPIVDRYVGFRRDLPDRAEDVPGWLPRKARAAARNARDKYGLEAAYGDEHLDEVWRLYARNMRRLASLAYPRAFFCSLIERLGQDRHVRQTEPYWVCIIRRQGRAVAGLVTFLFKDRVMPYFYGATTEARHCSAANYLYFETMRRGVAAGYRVFDFGRSRRNNSGSVDFKRFHGFEPTPLEYQLYVAPSVRSPSLSPTDHRFGLVRRIWPYLPLPLANALSARLVRHIPG